MKNQVECPHCRSCKKVSRHSKLTQILIGLGVALVGFGFLIVAVTGVTGYYLFSLPLLAVGMIGAGKEYTSPYFKAHCHDCKKTFEYVPETTTSTLKNTAPTS
ncbi:hypothetical protein [Mucilaginibacter myungsuensis]|uniref:Uncharacterized protein n=1 Tax=Mucilaginibacter myungsuensis TaxID=649104 RepID=A0A929KSZ6_9SPHI|nr:hypothetical protein [Mucilaginibacter myungsuensis]MBE9660612.1 hypothetical protein [Mucilaginibacter myungsuensis]MDN3600657.1 hypothetical protein [Mucilaginibacter myungsuensis]